MARHNVFDIAFRSFSMLISNPVTLLAIVISFAMVVSHTKSPTDSIVHKIAHRLSSNPSVQDWIETSENRIIGFIIFIPVIMGFRQMSMRFYYAIAILIWVAFVPEHSIFEYVIQSAILRLIVSLPPSYSHEKALIVLFVSILAITGYVFNFTGNVPAFNSTKVRERV